ncbi:hypothetical protein CGMCC3_g15617 [Colletotrichum fructicola]|nr:uncharacterized protein CGMCC3_g15617 [Colletotrichum fructicola]KAE9568253.1 hypothetical protein CGMCC3_g15617 [Colletotrichum fructicola]
MQAVAVLIAAAASPANTAVCWSNSNDARLTTECRTQRGDTG